MNGPLTFLTARKILPLLDLLAKFKRVLACSCSPNFCVARKLAKQIFYFCSSSQKNRSVRHARECSQRPFVTPSLQMFQWGYVSALLCLYGTLLRGPCHNMVNSFLKFIIIVISRACFEQSETLKM